MKKILTLGFACLSMYCSALAQKITSFLPASGPVGTIVTISGTGFASTPAANTVFFGSVKGTVTEASPTVLKVKVPAGATYQPISVTAGGLTGYSPVQFIPTFGCAGVLNGSTLAPKVNYFTGVRSSPAGIVAADLNNDGKPDLVTSAQDAGSLIIFENTIANNKIEGGSLGAGVVLSAGGGPTGIAAADFNNDGKMDLVTANFNSSSISVFQNLSAGGPISTGSFSEKIDFSTVVAGVDSSQSLSIAVGDLDGDGKTDIAVTNFKANTISIFRNTGTGGAAISSSTFTRFDLLSTTVSFQPSIFTPVSILIVDLDLDSRPDIVINNFQGVSMVVMRNTGSGGTLNAASFATRTLYNTSFGTGGLGSGDLNGDGKPDIALANAFSGTVTLYRNTGNGTISLASGVNLTTSDYPANVSFADLTGDGKPDLIVGTRDLVNAVNTSNGPVNIFPNTFTTAGGAFSLGAAANYAIGGSTGPLAISDLDADGKPELVVPNYYLDYISVLKNNSSSYSSVATGAVTATSTICDDGVWKNVSDPANPSNIICSIQDNGINLGTITSNLYVDAAPGNYQGSYYMARHFVIKPTVQPSGTIRVRLYFTDAEFSALQAADNSIISVQNLAVTKYQGPTEDGVFNPGDATSLNVIPSQQIVFGTAYGARYAEFNVNSLSEFWLHSNALALPVDIVSFDAAGEGDKVLLNWKVANETNLANYSIEHSNDGQSYRSIGTVAAAGASSYAFTDAFPSALNYYRLVQNDRDGKTKYSDVKFVALQSRTGATVKIAPHPVTSQSVIAIPVSKGTTIFTVLDQRGVQVRAYTLTSVGNETIRLNFAKRELPAGTYFYQVSNGTSQVQRGKIVIQ